MNPSPTRRKRCLPAALTVAVFASLIVLTTIRAPGSVEPAPVPQAVVYRDWPMLGGTAHRNMVNTVERNLPTTWEIAWTVDARTREKQINLQKSTNLKWAAKLGSRSYGGPIVAGGKVFVGTNNEYPRDPKIRGDRGVLMGFRAVDGQFLGQLVHPKLPSGQVNDWPKEGICSTPCVDGGRIYYVSNACELVCADVESFAPTKEPRILWRLPMMTTLGVYPHNMSNGSPVVVGSQVFVGTSNGVDEEHVNVPSPNAPSFIAFNKLTGRPMWSDNSPGADIMHGQWANAACTSVQAIVPGGDGWLRSFERASGKLIWKFDCNPKDSKYELGGRGTKSDFIAAPVIVGDRCYIGVGQDPEHFEGVGHLWCINITKTGDVSPELVVDARRFPPKTKPNPKSALIWHYGGLVSKEDAVKIGRDYYFGRTMSTVAVHDGLVYAAELAGYLHCLDAVTGRHYWAHDVRAAIWGSLYWVDGKVYLCTEDGEVWIFKHGKEKQEAGKMEMDQAIRTSPVAADGVLYIATESYLYAIRQRR
ncbi:MAG: PQQ-binding-like beta-propeller repeat protein [Gemmataceae bacterium]|nr:PQQ-binding-like beta-propeller repeat protein [Gemmataceae bacterium]